MLLENSRGNNKNKDHHYETVKTSHRRGRVDGRGSTQPKRKKKEKLECLFRRVDENTKTSEVQDTETVRDSSMGVVNLRRPCVVGNNLGSRPSDKGPGVPNGT